MFANKFHFVTLINIVEISRSNKFIVLLVFKGIHACNFTSFG